MGRAVLISAAAVASIGCVLSAFAQGSQQIDIGATVSTSCTLNGFASAPVINMAIPVDPVGIIDPTPQTFTVPNVICSTPIDLLATSLNEGVRSASPAPAGFTNVIDYKGTATYGKAKSFVITNTKGGAGKADSTKGPTNAPLVIEVAPRLPAAPLAAGIDYQDTLRITLTPK